jgi:hypothetical protein
MNFNKIVIIVFTLFLCGCSVPPLTFSVADVGVSKTKINADIKTITVTLARPDEAQGDMPLGIEGLTNLWKEALQEAIDKSAIFKDGSSNTVSVQTKIMALDVPSFGASMTTKSIARYQLIDRSSGKVVYAKDVTAEGVVPYNYAFAGVIRGRESINRSAQNNIKQFLEGLEAANIDKPVFPSEPQK